MNYLSRPGIVRARICGMTVLIPSRIAGDKCKTILPLTFYTGIIWAGIENDYPIEKVLEMLRIFSKLPDEQLIDRINAFCEKLTERGFAIPKTEAPAPAVVASPAGADVPDGPSTPHECHSERSEESASPVPPSSAGACTPVGAGSPGPSATPVGADAHIGPPTPVGADAHIGPPTPVGADAHIGPPSDEAQP